MKNIKTPISAVLLMLNSLAMPSFAFEVDANAWTSLDAPPPREEPKAAAYGHERSNETIRLASNSAPQPAQSMYFELLSQIEILQREVQDLRGIVEEQEYIINKLRREQKERYVDLDRRVSSLIRGEGTGSSWGDNNSSASAGDSGAADTSFGTEGGDVDTVSAGAATAGTAHDATGDSGRNGSSESKGEREAYIEAFGYIRDKEYDTAVKALNDFTNQYTSGKYAGNAYYWLGEIYSTVKLDLEKARDAFSLFLERYPNHRRVPDATYKLGVVYAKQGENIVARNYLERVIKDMSDTPAAASAQEYLDKL